MRSHWDNESKIRVVLPTYNRNEQARHEDSEASGVDEWLPLFFEIENVFHTLLTIESRIRRNITESTGIPMKIITLIMRVGSGRDWPMPEEEEGRKRKMVSMTMNIIGPTTTKVTYSSAVIARLETLFLSFSFFCESNREDSKVISS